MYVYPVFASTKDVIWKTKSIAKSCLLDSQKSLMEILKEVEGGINM